MGEEEEWRSYPPEPRYKVSNLGNVIGINGKIKTFRIRRGYHTICIRIQKRARTTSVHRMVMAAFVGVSDLQVDHIDGVRSNNKLSNLRYVTPSENYLHKRNFGTDNRGEKHSQVKLTNEQVLEIRRDFVRISSHQSNRIQLARKYNVGKDTIGLIVNRKTWRHI